MARTRQLKNLCIYIYTYYSDFRIDLTVYIVYFHYLYLYSLFLFIHVQYSIYSMYVGGANLEILHHHHPSPPKHKKLDFKHPNKNP